MFLKNNKYYSLGYDNVLIKYIKNKDISHVIVDSTFKVRVVDVKINNYYRYLIQEYLKKLIKFKQI